MRGEERGEDIMRGKTELWRIRRGGEKRKKGEEGQRRTIIERQKKRGERNARKKTKKNREGKMDYICGNLGCNLANKRQWKRKEKTLRQHGKKDMQKKGRVGKV